MFETKYEIILLVLLNVICSFCSNVIDVDDILSIDYMPGSLLMLENPDNKENYLNSSVSPKNENLVRSGLFNEAFSTMGYHR